MRLDNPTNRFQLESLEARRLLSFALPVFACGAWMPSLETILRIAGALEVDLAEIIRKASSTAKRKRIG